MIDLLKSLLNTAPAAPSETEAERLEREASFRAEQEQATARAETLTTQAKRARDTGGLTSAAIYYSEAVTLLRSANATAPLAHALRHAADVRSELGDYGAAGTLISEAILLYGAFSPPSPLDLANAHRVAALNNERQACDAWTQAHALYTAASVPAGIAECDHHLQRHATYAA